MNISVMRSLFICFFIISLCGCVTKRASEKINHLDSCAEQLRQARAEAFDVKLSSLSVLFDRGCYQEVINLGSEIRASNRDKYYSILNEATEVITYEGVSTDYTLDSHERIFLSILMSVSYLNMGKKVPAEVELKKAYDESTAQIYRSGTDEVNIFLQGLMWLQLSGWEKAAPFFYKIETTAEYSTHLKLFVKKLEMSRIRNSKSASVRVYTISHMPEVSFDWFSSYSKTYDPPMSVKNCLSENSIILSTLPWIKQIEQREHNQDDPVLTTKRMMRLPATLLYSASVLVAGGALTYATASSEASAYIAALTVYFTYRTFVNGLAPDMRAWRDLPGAFYVGLDSQEPSQNICMHRYPIDIYNVKEFFNFKTSNRVR